MGTIIILEMAAAWNMVTMMRTENISTGRAMEKRNDIIHSHRISSMLI